MGIAAKATDFPKYESRGIRKNKYEKWQWQWMKV